MNLVFNDNFVCAWDCTRKFYQKNRKYFFYLMKEFSVAYYFLHFLFYFFHWIFFPILLYRSEIPGSLCYFYTLSVYDLGLHSYKKLKIFTRKKHQIKYFLRKNKKKIEFRLKSFPQKNI